MNGKDRIDRINKMATVSKKYRANWKPQAERVAAEVEAEIARLRAFASHKPGFVADHCNTTANWLEAELKAAMAKFDCSENAKKCFYCDGEITQAQLRSADACGLGRDRYAHIDCIAVSARQTGIPTPKGRQTRPDVKELITAKLVIELAPGQIFAETPRAWEIWQEEPLARIKRICKDRVFWAIEY